MPSPSLPPPTSADRAPGTPARKDDLVAAARAVGDLLRDRAWVRGDAAGWNGLVPSQHGWSVEPLGPDLGNGRSGIILFLAYLGSVADDERSTVLAQDALKELRRQLRRSRGTMTSVGGFTGWGGPIYLLTHLGVLWAEPGLLDEAEALAEVLGGLVERDEALDMEAGTAGCLAALLSLYRCTGSRQTLRRAMSCGDRLLEGVAERLRGEGPLTALMPGAAGMAGPLLELAQATYAERFRSAAESLLACKRSGRLSADVLGQGRSLLQAVPQVEEALSGEITALLEAVAASEPCGNHSLGRGEMGVVQLFVEAAETYGRHRWRTEARTRAAAVLAEARQSGWVCDTPTGAETPGLLRGLAGIGYGLLRLAQPNLVPSVLTLAPPQTL
jgi:lantibiotic modifying enzyme